MLTAVPWLRVVAPRTWHHDGHETARLVPTPRSRDLLVICSTVNKINGDYWLYKRSANLPVHRLFLSDPQRRWYTNGVPGLADSPQKMADWLHNFKEEHGIRHIYMVGHSMGAYGAMLLGGLVKASRILAFSPECVLGTPQSRSLRHVQGLVGPDSPEVFAAAWREVAPRITVIYGQFDLIDFISAGHIHRLDSRVRLQELPGCSHNTPSFLMRRGLLDKALRDLLSDGPMAQHIAFVNPSAVAPGLLEIAQYIPAGIGRQHLVKALGKFQELVKAPVSDQALILWRDYWRATLLVRLRRYPEALAILTPLIEEAQRDGHAAVLGLCGRTYRLLGDDNNALPMLRQAVDLDQSLTSEACVLAELHMSQGHHQAAIAVVDTLLRWDPDHRHALRLSETLAPYRTIRTWHCCFHAWLKRRWRQRYQ